MINENTIQLTVSFSRLGVRRAVPKSKAQVEVLEAGQVNVDARPEKDSVHVGAEILDSPQLKAIASLDTATKAYIATRAVPVPVFKSGVYMVNLDLVEPIYQYLEEQAKRRASLVEDFIDQYPKLIEAARENLKGLFNPAHYPSAEIIRGSFAMTWNLREWTVSGKLKSLSKALYDKEVAKIDAEVADMRQSIEDALAVSLSGMVNHFVERLSADDDGKAKKFEATTVTKLQEFLDLYRMRKPGENASLDTLVEQAQKVLSGVDVKMIKTDTAIKDRVAQGFAEIKTALDAIPAVARPARAIALADEAV